MAKGDSRTVQLIIGAKDATAQAFKSVTGSLDKLRLGAVAAAGAIATAVTGFIGGKLFAGAISSAADFEQAMAKVQAVTRATPEDFQRLKAAAELAGSTTQFTATQAAEALEILARSGLSAEQSIAALPTVLALASAEGMSLDRAAGAITDTLGQFNLGVGEAARIADVFVAASQRANTNVSELSEGFKVAGPLAAGFGLSVEETAGYLGVLADSGVRGAEAGTALRNILQSLNNSSSKTREALRALGITSGDLGTVITELSTRGDDASSVIQAFDSASQAAIGTLVRNAAAAREFGEGLKDVGGTAQEAADVMGSTFQGSVLSLQSAWDALRRALVEPLLQPLAKEFGALAEGIRTVTTNSLEGFRAAALTAFETAAVAVRKFLGELKPEELLTRLGAIVTGITTTASNIIASFDAIGKTVSTFTAGVQVAFNGIATFINGVVAGILAPFGLLGAALTKAAEGLNRLGVISDESASKVTNLGTTLTAMSTDALERTANSAGRTVDAIGDLATAVTAVEQPAQAATTSVAGLAAEVERLPHPVDVAREALAKLHAEGADTAALEAAQQRVNEEMRKAADTAFKLMKAYYDATVEVDQLVASGAGIEDIRDAMERAAKAQEAYTEALSKTTDEFLDQAAASDDVADAQDRVSDSTDTLRERAERLGLEWDAVTNTLTAGTQQNIADLRALAQSGQVTGTQLKQALDTSIAAARSKADLEAIREAWLELGRQGKISTDELNAGIADLDAKIAEAGGAAQTLAERMNAAADALRAKREASDGAAKSSRSNASAMREEAAAAKEAGDSAEDAAEKTDKAAGSARKSASAWSLVTPALRAATFQIQLAADGMLKKAANADLAARALMGLYRMAMRGSTSVSTLIYQLQQSARAYRALAAAQAQAESATAGLEIQLAQLRGEQQRAIKLQTDQAVAQLQVQLLQAEIDGNKEKAAEIRKAIALTKELGREQAKQAKDAERESAKQKESNKILINQQKAMTESAERKAMLLSQPDYRSPPESSAAPMKDLGKLTINIGGQNLSVLADDATAKLLQKLIKDQARAQ